MLKKTVIGLLSVLLLFGLLGPVSAQPDWLPKAGTTPDSPFYFLDKLSKNISMTFAFSPKAKANKALNYSEERLAEIKKLSGEDKEEALKKASEEYERYLDLAQEKKKQIEEEERVKVSERVAEATSRHLGVLEEVHEKVPEQAKQGIKRAMEASTQGRERAMEALEKASEKGTKGASEALERAREKTPEGVIPGEGKQGTGTPEEAGGPDETPEPPQPEQGEEGPNMEGPGTSSEEEQDSEQTPEQGQQGPSEMQP